ncbi:MAG: hypothetical protein KKI09_11900 [Spirochaetes bacterium]|nr:hypothetical protein [Spirochaetota bacterium]MBU0956123.1 hypothetical protein [Spirochaetota bacterium]
MKKTTKVTIIVLAVLLAFSMSACEWLFGVAMSVNGTAVNVMAESTSVATEEYWKGESTTGQAITLTGATVSLTPIAGGAALTGEVMSDGSWIITDISTGRYIMSGSKSGWTFIPTEVEVSGLFQDVTEELLAYPTQSDQTILLIAKWKNRKIDVDSYLVIDNDEDMAASTYTVGYSQPQYPASGTATVSLDRDVRFDPVTDTVVNSEQAVETIRIISNPFGAGSGYLRYYLDAYGYYDSGLVADNGYVSSGGIVKGGTLTGNPDATTFKERAEARVYIMQGDTLFGTWPLPVDTAEATLGILRIQVTGGTPTGYLFYSFGSYDTPRVLNSFTPVGVDEIR